jgi:hypothetical protein
MNDALCLMSDGIENRFLLLLMHFTFEYLHLAAPDSAERHKDNRSPHHAAGRISTI